jgi:hypothetical protein
MTKTDARGRLGKTGLMVTVLYAGKMDDV